MPNRTETRRRGARSATKGLRQPEKVLYVWTLPAAGAGADFLSVIDANLASPTYGTKRTEFPQTVALVAKKEQRARRSARRGGPAVVILSGRNFITRHLLNINSATDDA